MAQKTLLILGAGTAGTLLANKLLREISDDWTITVVDPAGEHLYQPGLLFLPFGMESESEIVRPRAPTLHGGVAWVRAAVSAIEPDQKRVRLEGGESIAYDILVIASGCLIRPDLVEGLEGPGWRERVFDFYTLDGAKALRDRLDTFREGRLVVNIVELPIKCPVAPLEFAFLADDFFRHRGCRDQVEIVLATPLDGAFTKPIAKEKLGHLLTDKGIKVETEFATGQVDGEKGEIVSFDERRVAFDLLVSIPTHSGAGFVETSQIGNELAFVPTDPRTLRAKGLEDVFVIGDATDVPTSKAGSVAHFEGDVLAKNLARITRGEEPHELFDGHANCFVETGNGKAMLIDFNYEVEPLPGKFPFAGIGPFSLLTEGRMNHVGKLAFKWVYWNGLLPGNPIPLPAAMSMSGKEVPPRGAP